MEEMGEIIYHAELGEAGNFLILKVLYKAEEQQYEKSANAKNAVCHCSTDDISPARARFITHHALTWW